MRIAIDAMGGDAGPSVIVDGALVAARHLQVGLLLVGDAATAPSTTCRGASSPPIASTAIQITSVFRTGYFSATALTCRPL